MNRRARLKRALAIGALLALALVVWLGVGDRVKAAGRVLHIVNETGSEASVRIDVVGSAPAVGDGVTAGSKVTLLSLKPGSRHELLLAEGRYQASVVAAGRVGAEVVEFTLDGDFMERLSDRTAFVLNVDRAATFLWEQEEYGPTPSGRRERDRVLFGEAFFVSRDVDYAFAPFPETLDASEGSVVRSRLSVFRRGPSQALRRFSEDDPRALDYAERRLSPGALDEALLTGYLRLARERGLEARALEFLRAGLSPISIPWHRAYQDRVRARGADAEAALRSDYARRVAEAPKDARLLYLRGRIAEDPQVRQRYYRDAVAADDECAFAHHALAVLALRRGLREEALTHAQSAARSRPRDVAMADLAYRVRFALGDSAALARENAARREAQPVDLLLMRRALELAAAQGDANQGRELLQAYRQQVRARLPRDPQQLVLHSELMWLGLERETAELVKRASGLRAPSFRARVLCEAYLDAGELEAAEAAFGQAEEGAAWTRADSLWLSVAWGRRGDVAAEARWRERASALLSQGSKAEARSAELLRDDVTELDRVLPLSVSPSLKAALLLSLGEDAPALREAAKRFDVTRYFPHGVLTRR